MYPKLKILLNKEFDKEICSKFINKQKAGIDFGAGIIKTHPELALAKSSDEAVSKKIICDYFNTFYLENEQRLNLAIDETETEWKRVENRFYKLCDLYFDNQKWPNGKYEAYLSIISCNPRFLDNKTFQFFLEK